MKQMIFGLGLVLAAMLGLSPPIQADVIAAPLGSGTRTEGSQIKTIGNWATDSRTFSISWDISFDGSVYTYVYTLDGYAGPDISHLAIAASDGRPGTIAFTEESVLGVSGYPIEVGNLYEKKLGAPGDLYGLKFDFGDEAPFTYTLMTDRAPIWGSFFAKAGKNSGAYNIGWSTWGDYLADTSIQGFVFDASQWIAVPDSRMRPHSVVPEPTSLVSLGLGLASIGLIAVRARRRVAECG